MQAWRDDAHAPATLFFTAFESTPPKALDPLLKASCFGLLPGVHRILFEDGKVQLTLCIGEAPAIGREIDIAADSVLIDHLDPWGGKHIARVCKRGTALCWHHANPEALAELQQAGIQVDAQSSAGVFEPHWTPKSSLRSSRTHAEKTQNPHAVVIGAGLSGAAVAHSLATRGWFVEVIDRGTALGAGASGLPAGIFATHVSPDNNVLSRITRDGVRATLHRARKLLTDGTLWQVSQLLEHRYAGKRQLPEGDAWPAEGHAWSTEATEDQKLAGGLTAQSPALWHPLAGWLQTPAFVKAQLTHPNIKVRTHCDVHTLRKSNGMWQLLDSQGETLASASEVILASAHDCQALLDTIDVSAEHSAMKRPTIPATALRGQVTWGSMTALSTNLQAKLPACPVNGHGSFISNLPSLNSNSNDKFWIVGSSFQRNDFDLSSRQEDLKSNLQQWSELMPALKDDIAQGVDTELTHSWVSIRSALPDRVPAVGAFLHPDFQGLQVCTGMGARGISWSVLCGELLAAHFNHEPLPMAASLASRLAASRFG